MFIKKIFKWIARIPFQDYQLNRIYYLECNSNKPLIVPTLPSGTTISMIESPTTISESSDQQLRDHGWYAGEHTIGYGVWQQGQLVCICWFWTSNHQSMPSRFSNLGHQEAVMVDLLTTSACRGLGYAGAVTSYAAHDLKNKGYVKLWTWVWHNNFPSIKTFTKAGWNYVYFLMEFKFRGMRDYLCLKLPPIGNTKS